MTPEPLGADQPFAAPNPPGCDQQAEAGQIFRTDHEPAGTASNHVPVDLVGRIDVLAIVGNGGIEVLRVLKHLAGLPFPAVGRDSHGTEQSLVDDILQVPVPEGGQRLAQPDIASAAVPGDGARFRMGVVVVDRVPRPFHPIRDGAVNPMRRHLRVPLSRLVPPVVTALQDESAPVVDQFPPGEGLVMPFIQVLVGMRQLVPPGPGLPDGFVRVDPAVVHRQPQQGADEAFPQ